MNPDGHASEPAALLERVFERIGRERMAGLPVVNGALRVEAVGFARVDAGWAGVMLTPWFINLMLLPARDVAWQPLALGQRRLMQWPAGRFEMLGGEEPELGPYLYCTMFSTMSAFGDHASALEAALELRRCLFDAGTEEKVRQMNPSGLQWLEAPRLARERNARRDFLLGGARASS